MCNTWCLQFVEQSLPLWPALPDVLEAGSRNVNGSPRYMAQPLSASYVGIDLEAGEGVDRVLAVEDLPKTFGQAFNVIISTEMLEHVHDWRAATGAMLEALRPNGLLILTTRSPGFEYHPYPEDNWRFTLEHMVRIFDPPAAVGGVALRRIQPDPDQRNGVYCGVGVIAQRLNMPLTRWQTYLQTVKVFDVHRNREA